MKVYWECSPWVYPGIWYVMDEHGSPESVWAHHGAVVWRAVHGGERAVLSARPSSLVAGTAYHLREKAYPRGLVQCAVRARMKLEAV